MDDINVPAAVMAAIASVLLINTVGNLIGHTIKASDIQRANDICAVNDGVASIEYKMLSNHIVTCTNGGEFRIRRVIE